MLAPFLPARKDSHCSTILMLRTFTVAIVSTKGPKSKNCSQSNPTTGICYFSLTKKQTNKRTNIICSWAYVIPVGKHTAYDYLLYQNNECNFFKCSMTCFKKKKRITPPKSLSRNVSKLWRLVGHSLIKINRKFFLFSL